MDLVRRLVSVVSPGEWERSRCRWGGGEEKGSVGIATAAIGGGPYYGVETIFWECHPHWPRVWPKLRWYLSSNKRFLDEVCQGRWTDQPQRTRQAKADALRESWLGQLLILTINASKICDDDQAKEFLG